MENLAQVAPVLAQTTAPFDRTTTKHHLTSDPFENSLQYSAGKKAENYNDSNDHTNLPYPIIAATVEADRAAIRS